MVFPERQVALLPLDPFPEERLLYEQVTEVVRGEYRRRIADRNPVLPLLTLQREVCSSAQAVARTLAVLAETDREGPFRALLDLARSVTRQRKALTLVDLVREVGRARAAV